MTDEHQPRRGGPAALLALPLLCCGGHALVLALGMTSLAALLTTRTPVIVLVGLLVLAALGLAGPTVIRSLARNTDREQS